MAELDPITFEVIWHKIQQACEEMGISYVRCSGSPVILSANDFNVAMTLPDGALAAMGPFMTVHANVSSLLVRSLLERFTPEEIHDGDMFICNDPYLGVVHQADLSMLQPVFYDGELVAWTVSTGHQVDIGGMDPGGFSMAVVDVQQEGLRIPHVKFVERGALRRDIFDWILNQVRDPIVGLDLKAQMAANTTGARRLRELIEKYGLKRVHGVLEGIIEHSEARLRARLRELPDGTWREVQYLDHDGHGPTVRQLVVTMTKAGDRLTFDFTGTDPQARSCINCTRSMMMAGLLTPVLVMLCYDIPWNEGILRCIETVAPEGTLNNATYPSPCSMATLGAGWMTANLCMMTIGKLLSTHERYRRDVMAGWVGSCQYPALAGINQHGRRFSAAEMSHHAGGAGARCFRDGVDMAGVVFNVTPSIPNIEENEYTFPILYLFRRQLQDSGGPGRYRGGAAGEICYVLHDAPAHELQTVLVSSGAEMPNAMGLFGGLPGGTIRWVRIRGADIRERLRDGRPLPATLDEIQGEREVFPPMHPRLPFVEDEAWYSNWQGGGGYGDPLDRDPSLVARDVVNQLVSPASAEAIYGVVFRQGTSEPDVAATAQRRQALRQARLGNGEGRGSQSTVPETAPALQGRGERLQPGEIGPAARFKVGDLLGLAEDGRAWCLRCGAMLSTAGNYKERAIRWEAPLSAAGPIRGELYDRGRFVLACWGCPGCGVLLDAGVRLKGSPEWADMQLRSTARAQHTGR
ncbi:MAG: hydantoinase B/oxoprolinase family protein [Deltaproteobacteria bacterium]|nr:hydantoinase B/oxoprolinase family protein [Deltaproteobacteria bacterium]